MLCTITEHTYYFTVGFCCIQIQMYPAILRDTVLLFNKDAEYKCGPMQRKLGIGDDATEDAIGTIAPCQKIISLHLQLLLQIYLRQNFHVLLNPNAQLQDSLKE
jgi:hypothetical protein